MVDDVVGVTDVSNPLVQACPICGYSIWQKQGFLDLGDGRGPLHIHCAREEVYKKKQAELESKLLVYKERALFYRMHEVYKPERKAIAEGKCAFCRHTAYNPEFKLTINYPDGDVETFFFCDSRCHRYMCFKVNPKWEDRND